MGKYYTLRQFTKNIFFSTRNFFQHAQNWFFFYLLFTNDAWLQYERNRKLNEHLNESRENWFLKIRLKKEEEMNITEFQNDGILDFYVDY